MDTSYPNADKIAATASLIFKDDFKKISVLFTLAANFYGPSLELNVHDIIRARHAIRLIENDALQSEDGAALELVRVVVRKGVADAFQDLYRFLDFVADKAGLDVDVYQLPEIFKPMNDLIKSFENN